MESSVAVPMVHQFTMACLPPSSDGGMDEVVPLQQQRIGGRQFVDTGKIEIYDFSCFSFVELFLWGKILLQN